MENEKRIVELKNLIYQLVQYYPRMAQNTKNEYFVTSWAQRLSRYDIRAIKKAFSEAPATFKGFPSLSDLVELIRLNEDSGETHSVMPQPLETNQLFSLSDKINIFKILNTGLDTKNGVNEEFEKVVTKLNRAPFNTVCGKCTDTGAVFATKRKNGFDYRFIFRCTCSQGAKVKTVWPVWGIDFIDDGYKILN